VLAVAPRREQRVLLKGGATRRRVLPPSMRVTIPGVVRVRLHVCGALWTPWTP
jgi:hypothetical protein